jgi:hypothetical protein
VSCHGIRAAYQHNEVNIGWFSFRAIRRTLVRTKPGAGNVIDFLDQGRYCGRQSVRNPHRKSDPAMRLSQRGADGQFHCWVYTRKETATGWVAVRDLDQFADPDKRPLTGPAGLDFEVGRGTPALKEPSGCGKVSGERPIKRVQARETYLRYSPRGTAFHYLHRGDLVKLLIVDGPQGFCFVEVVQSSRDGGVPREARGWVLAESLG